MSTPRDEDIWPVELALISSLIHEPAATLDAIIESGLHPKDLSCDPHRELLAFLIDRVDRNLPVDLLAVHQAIQAGSGAERYGGWDLLEGLGARPAYNALWAATEIRAAAQIRRAAELGRWLQRAAQAPVPKGERAAHARILCLRAEQQAAALSAKSGGLSYVPAADYVAEWSRDVAAIESGELTPATSTGIETFDDAHGGGLHQSDLVILAGRTAMGKTSGACSLVKGALLGGHPVLAASIEMPGWQFVAKVAAAAAKDVIGPRHRVSYGALRARSFSSTQQRQDCERVMRWAADQPLRVDAVSNYWPEIRAQLRTTHRKMTRQGLEPRLIVIDYLGMVEEEQSRDGRQSQLERIVKGAKALAKSLNVCILLLVQVNRAAEDGKSAIPSMRHLRGSGAIEQAADSIIFTYRPGYYIDGHADDEVDWIIAKSRHGETQVVSLGWHGPTGRVDDRAFLPPLKPPAHDAQPPDTDTEEGRW